jgi:beta-galactosidase/beta-glucuronidase
MQSGYAKTIEMLYQQAQEAHRQELQLRTQNIAKLEEAQKKTAETFQGKITSAVSEADAKIKAMEWKTNQVLIAADASKNEILGEKTKVEDALTVMTLNRNDLVVMVKDREIQILLERSLLKTAVDAAVKAQQDALDLCEKARESLRGESTRSTWFSIGPSAQVTFRGGVATVDYGVSLQIPLITIRSPFR